MQLDIMVKKAENTYAFKNDLLNLYFLYRPGTRMQGYAAFKSLSL